MNSFRRIIIQAIHISTITCWHVLFINLYIYIYIYLFFVHQYLLIVMSEITIYWGFFGGVLVFMAYLILLTWLYNLSLVIPGVSSVVFVRYALIMNTLL